MTPQQKQWIQNATSQQFGVANTPYHTHNGIDSSKITINSITPFYLTGTITVPTTGDLTSVNDGRILATSIMIATPQLTSSPVVSYAVSVALGTAGIFSASSASPIPYYFIIYF